MKNFKMSSVNNDTLFGPERRSMKNISHLHADCVCCISTIHFHDIPVLISTAIFINNILATHTHKNKQGKFNVAPFT